MTVDKVIHQPDVLTSPDQPHCFAYHITIHNDGDDELDTDDEDRAGPSHTHTAVSSGSPVFEGTRRAKKSVRDEDATAAAAVRAAALG